VEALPVMAELLELKKKRKLTLVQMRVLEKAREVGRVMRQGASGL
jgi:hypothetical protein